MEDTKQRLTEEEEAERGALLAAVLCLEHDSVYPDRWKTKWGAKTDLGLFRMIAGIVEKGQDPWGPR